ncbi:unnamed protein product [Sphagnum troendelagicum]|uniref:Uncharacterized protein n=1 Tax=Sphagnum troendelagicum TaxID=128251 RepID=A0ABP0UGF7_9BRYO
MRKLLLTVRHIRLSLGSPVEDERRGGEGGSNGRHQLCSDRSERKTAAKSVSDVVQRARCDRQQRQTRPTPPPPPPNWFQARSLF